MKSRLKVWLVFRAVLGSFEYFNVQQGGWVTAMEQATEFLSSERALEYVREFALGFNEGEIRIQQFYRESAGRVYTIF